MDTHKKPTQTASAPETRTANCRHCERQIVKVDGIWIDPEATGDDEIWREVCDSHDTFDAIHEPKRTIPAEKPTNTHRGWQGTEMELRELTKVKAHADKLAEALRKLRKSIRHAHNCKAPQAYPCSCDADALWHESAEALAAYEEGK